MLLRGRSWRLRQLVQLGSCWGRTLSALPDDSHGGEATSGSQIPASERPEGQRLARTVNAPGTLGKQRFRVRFRVCAAGVSRQLCAKGGKASPDAGNRRPPGPFPSVRASRGFDEASGDTRTPCATGASGRRRTAPGIMKPAARSARSRRPSRWPRSRRGGARSSAASTRSARSRYVARDSPRRWRALRAPRRLSRTRACRSVRDPAAATSMPPMVAASAGRSTARGRSRDSRGCVRDPAWPRTRGSLRRRSRPGASVRTRCPGPRGTARRGSRPPAFCGTSSDGNRLVRQARPAFCGRTRPSCRGTADNSCTSLLRLYGHVAAGSGVANTAPAPVGRRGPEQRGVRGSSRVRSWTSVATAPCANSEHAGPMGHALRAEGQPSKVCNFRLPKVRNFRLPLTSRLDGAAAPSDHRCERRYTAK